MDGSGGGGGNGTGTDTVGTGTEATTFVTVWAASEAIGEGAEPLAPPLALELPAEASPLRAALGASFVGALRSFPAARVSRFGCANAAARRPADTPAARSIF